MSEATTVVDDLAALAAHAAAGESTEMKRWSFALVLAAAALSGCGSGTNFDWNNARALKAGMTSAEVEQKMGKPYMVRTGNGQTTWNWTYVDPMFATKTVTVVFQDGKVVQVPEIPASFK